MHFLHYHDNQMIFLPLKKCSGTSLAVQWLRLHTSNAEDVGLIPGWGTKISHAAGVTAKKKKKCNKC